MQSRNLMLYNGRGSMGSNRLNIGVEWAEKWTNQWPSQLQLPLDEMNLEPESN